MRLKRWSNPTVERHRGVRSYVLIAISSFEQHGYEATPDTVPGGR